MHSDPSDLFQFPDAINISVQHLPSSLHFPTCSLEVPPQDFGEIPTSWEEYASQQPHLSSDLESLHNALLTHLESPASFPPLLDTEPPSLTLDQPIPSSMTVSVGQMPSFTQSNPDLSQFLDALPAAPLAQQHPHSSSASPPPFSSQAQSSSHSGDHRSSSSTPNQDIPSAIGSVGSDGDCAMDCDDDIILKSDGPGGDIFMDIDGQCPPYEPLFYHPSEVRVPSHTTPTTSMETPAQTYDSPQAQPTSFTPTSYPPPTQPLGQPPTFVQDPPYNRSTYGRDVLHCEPTLMQEKPLCRTVSDLLGTPQNCS